jgi:AcrR family transcriptional regulator
MSMARFGINAVNFALMKPIINAKKFVLTGENPVPGIAEKAAPRRREGGRSARVLDAVADAALLELSENGIENFSIPRVAARAGVSSSSLYRRWPNKAALIGFAGGRVAQEGIPFPDCGSLREDLIRVLIEVSEAFKDPKTRSMIAMAFSNSDSLEVQHTQQVFWKLRVEQQQAMFDRAIARGEIDKTADTGEIVERAVGPLFFRYFMSRRPVTNEFIEDLANSVLGSLPVPSVRVLSQ